MKQYVGVCVVLLAAGTAAASLATTPFRVEMTQSGSILSISLQDIDKTTVKIDVPTTVSIETVHGRFHWMSSDWKTADKARLTPGMVIRPIELRTDSLFSADMTVIVTVTPEGGPTIQSSKSVTLQPDVLTALIAAVAGALAWALYAFTTGARTWSRFAGSLTGALFAGSVAFVAARFDALWKLIGISPDSFQWQAYVLLGLVVAYRGVPWVLGRFTGDDTKPVSAVRTAVREELQQLLLADPDYLKSTPSFIEKVETSLTTAKYGKVDPDLLQFLRPRLDELFTISHREKFKTSLDVRICPDWFEWEDVTSYDLVRNPNDPSTGPEVRYSHVEDVPMALRAKTKDELEQFGSLLTFMSLKIESDTHGTLLYEGSSDKKLLLTAPLAGCEARDRIDVRFSFDETKHELLFAYDFELPPPFSDERRIAIESVVHWRGKAEDGLYAVRLGRLTFGYYLTYRFTPPVRNDHTLFLWHSLSGQYKEEEKKSGIANLPGWLVPGNGICVSYTGTTPHSPTEPDESSRVIK
jgi:hypothetical protein